jgi:hypothetical protein
VRPPGAAEAVWFKPVPDELLPASLELDADPEPPLLPLLEPPEPELELELLSNPLFLVLPHAATTALQPRAQKGRERRTRIAKTLALPVASQEARQQRRMLRV